MILRNGGTAGLLVFSYLVLSVCSCGGAARCYDGPDSFGKLRVRVSDQNVEFDVAAGESGSHFKRVGKDEITVQWGPGRLSVRVNGVEIPACAKPR
jgi:hypothetical protein